MLGSTMSSSVISFPGPWLRVSEKEKLIQAASQELLSVVMDQPVPVRLHALATELGRALDKRSAELSPVEKEREGDLS